uniref:Uncharacterized protein n=1 Tax=Zea mays TaxID=4577 RepID=A0A804LCS6_MAIZE
MHVRIACQLNKTNKNPRNRSLLQIYNNTRAVPSFATTSKKLLSVPVHTRTGERKEETARRGEEEEEKKMYTQGKARQARRPRQPTLDLRSCVPRTERRNHGPCIVAMRDHHRSGAGRTGGWWPRRRESQRHAPEADRESQARSGVPSRTRPTGTIHVCWRAGRNASAHHTSAPAPASPTPAAAAPHAHAVAVALCPARSSPTPPPISSATWLASLVSPPPAATALSAARASRCAITRT